MAKKPKKPPVKKGRGKYDISINKTDLSFEDLLKTTIPPRKLKDK